MLSPVSYHSQGRNREVGRADDPDSWAGIKHAFVVATAGFVACRRHRWRVAADLSVVGVSLWKTRLPRLVRDAVKRFAAATEKG
jgi:hypothetical protein